MGTEEGAAHYTDSTGGATKADGTQGQFLWRSKTGAQRKKSATADGGLGRQKNREGKRETGLYERL